MSVFKFNLLFLQGQDWLHSSRAPTVKILNSSATNCQTRHLVLIGLILAALLLCTACPRLLSAAPVKSGCILPQPISDRNAKITFAVGPTWCLVEGKTAGMTGRVWLKNPQDGLSIQALVDVPPARIDACGEMWGQRLREVMDSGHAPYVSLSINSLRPSCNPASFAASQSRPAELLVKLTIRETERPMKLQGALQKQSLCVALTGERQFSWPDFGFEGPSILVAKLGPEVAVPYSVTIPTTKG